MIEEARQALAAAEATANLSSNECSGATSIHDACSTRPTKADQWGRAVERLGAGRNRQARSPATFRILPLVLHLSQSVVTGAGY